MNNLLILGFYHYADGYYALGQHFNSHFDNVYFFPFMMYIHNLDDTRDYNLVKDIKSKIINDNITHVLIWHNIDSLNSNKHYFSRIFNFRRLNQNLKFILIDWDPHTDKNVNSKSNIYVNTCINYIFYSSPFKLINNPNTNFFFKAGFSPNTSYYEYNAQYQCDVVFIGTNLYTDNMWENKHMNRKIVMDEIIKDKQINLHIYGIPNSNIQNIYPDNFKGYIPYNQCYLAFSNALFSLNISPLNDICNNGYYYYSERLPQILACNSIMISNNDFGNLLTPNVDYIYLKNSEDLKNLNNIILDFKTNPNKAETMKDNYKKKLHKFNYEKTVKQMCKIILNK